MFYKKPTRSDHGFTLLEMGFVLFILLVMVGMAIPMTSGLIAQERLKAQAKELQDYARSARKLAVTEGRPYAIVLNKKGFMLETRSAGGKREIEVVRSHLLASNVSYHVQRWGEKGPGIPAGETWVFQPDGICEPIRVHFESRDGWIEDTFNPLTARTQDESYHFP